MGDSDVMDQQMDQEVRRWLELLLTSTGEDRKKAASALSRLGVRTRGSIRPRGSLDKTPKNRLPEPEKIEAVIECLRDQDKEMRTQVALALGEWGGGEAAAALSRILQSDPDEDVQLYCITALRTIGGPTSAEALRKAALSGTEAARDAAISAIEDLTTGGRVDCTEGPDPAHKPMASPTTQVGAVHFRGAIRKRGGAQAGGAQAGLVNNIADTLQQIRNDKGASDYLRLRAEEVLETLVQK